MTGVGGLGDCERDDITSSLEKSETANNDNNLFFLEQSELVNSKEKNQSESQADNSKEEMIREKLILDNNDSGKGEVPSSLDESEASSSKEKIQIEGQAEDAKAENAKAETLTEDVNVFDNNDRGRENLKGIEMKKKKKREIKRRRQFVWKPSVD